MKLNKSELIEAISKLNKAKPLTEGKEIQRVAEPANADALEQHEEALKQNAERRDPKNYAKEVKELIKDTASEESRYRHFDVVDRKDLAKQINEAKEKGLPFKVSRSTKEGFRYDLAILNEDFMKKEAGDPEINKDAFNNATDVQAASPTAGLGEELKIFTDSADGFHPSAKAKAFWDEIRDAGKKEDLEYALETLYPDGISDVALDDLLVHEEDWVRDLIGLEPGMPETEVEDEFEDEDVEPWEEDDEEEYRESEYIDAQGHDTRTGEDKEANYRAMGVLEDEEMPDDTEFTEEESEYIDEQGHDTRTGEDKEANYRAMGLLEDEDDLDPRMAEFQDLTNEMEKAGVDILDEDEVAEYLQEEKEFDDDKIAGVIMYIRNKVMEPEEEFISDEDMDMWPEEEPLLTTDDMEAGQWYEDWDIKALDSEIEEEDKEPLQEADKPASESLEDCQKWVDYDMEHYGKISDNTNEIVKKAGFQIIKDDHGDYEVAACKFENLQEEVEQPKEEPVVKEEESLDEDLDAKIAEGFIEKNFKPTEEVSETHTLEEACNKAVNESQEDDEVVVIDDEAVDNMLGAPKAEGEDKE